MKAMHKLTTLVSTLLTYLLAETFVKSPELDLKIIFCQANKSHWDIFPGIYVSCSRKNQSHFGPCFSRVTGQQGTIPDSFISQASWDDTQWNAYINFFVVYLPMMVPFISHSPTALHLLVKSHNTYWKKKHLPFVWSGETICKQFFQNVKSHCCHWWIWK